MVKTTNSSGGSVESFAYSPYGVSDDPAGFPFRFTGQKLDPETGLYYYKARYYDPETGRFLQTDPIGYEDQMNLYAYVGNDPVNFIDPFGFFTSCTEYADAGNAGGCREIDGVTGESFETLEDAALAAAPELLRIQEETDSEVGIAFSENEDGTITPTVAVTGTRANPNGERNRVNLSGLLKGTDNPVGDAHTHPNNRSFQTCAGNVCVGNDLPIHDRRTAQYAQQEGSTYTSYVFKRVDSGFGAADRVTSRLVANPDPRPGAAEKVVARGRTQTDVFWVRF